MIREGGDSGAPVAINEDSITGQAFATIAANVIEHTDFRNENFDPTKKVKVSRK